MAVWHLLLVDNYKSCNSELIFIPAVCMPLIQPMDVFVTSNNACEWSHLCNAQFMVIPSNHQSRM